MIKIKYLIPVIIGLVLFVSCSKDDHPEYTHEEELITTMTVTLKPSGSGNEVVLSYEDLDGVDGPKKAEISVVGEFASSSTYNGTIKLLNKTEDPAENITEEVEEEAEEHQFFYTVSEGLNITTAYVDKDKNGNDLGLKFTLTTGEASSGTLTITLRHEPKKPSETLADAGGETDVTATFNVAVK